MMGRVEDIEIVETKEMAPLINWNRRGVDMLL
jgi:hypothetical protein